MFRPPLFARFRTRLLLLIFLVVVPALVLALHSNLEQRRAEKTRVKESAVAIAEVAAATQEQFIRNTRQLLATLAEFPFLVLGTNAEYSNTHFANLRKLSPDYLNFGLINLDGKVFSDGTAQGPGTDLSDRPYFERVVQTRRFAIGDFQVGRISGQPCLNFGFPVLDEHGALYRVLFASLKLSLLSEATAKVHVPRDGAINIIDRSGHILARNPDPEKWVGRNMASHPLVQRILGDSAGTWEAPGLDGLPRLHAVTPISDGESASLFVCVGFPLKASFAAANRTLLLNVVGIGLTTLAVLLAAWWYAERSFLAPVATLVGAARQLAEGDLKARTHLGSGTGELHVLARVFDDMAERLQQREAEIGQAWLRLEQRVEERTTELKAANQELEAFSYSVSHDLRAPLRHMHGFAQLLRRSCPDLNEKAFRYVGEIEDATKKMAQLIDDLLAFSRAARQPTRKVPVSTKKLVDEVIAEFASETQSRSIQWAIGELPEVTADPAMLRQVWANLLGNAVKYTRPREQARIEISNCSAAPNEITFCVRDNGVGFDMKYANNLFGVFQRLHSEREFEGAGIGLANVRRIVHRHGGRTWAESTPNEGATFYFSLPK